ncbi:MAG: hypothetical protein J3Q66DRAFT_346345 [Benniella sp.]|nr:MAG: hypothetical protein J3Q66DRAFT_346345 [Benniella sp.]
MSSSGTNTTGPNGLRQSSTVEYAASTTSTASITTPSTSSTASISQPSGSVFSQTVSGISATGRSLTSIVTSGLQQPRHRIMELLHSFDVSNFTSSARNTLSATSNIMFSPLTAQAVKGDLTGIASLTGLSGMAPHLMATQYLRRAQTLAIAGGRPGTPMPADQLLAEEIPEPVAQVSLFQGFKATYPGDHLHSKGGKMKGQHGRKNGYGEVDEDDPSKAFSSLLSERDRTIKEQVRLQDQKVMSGHMVCF